VPSKPKCPPLHYSTLKNQILGIFTSRVDTICIQRRLLLPIVGVLVWNGREHACS
jgi:hypothetical protein